MLRIMKILLVLSVGAWALLSALGNIIGWNGVIGAVAATTSMTTIEGGADSWRATTNPAFIFAGALFIVSLKVIAGLLCIAGAGRMLTALTKTASEFARSKSLGLTGCAVAMFMLFGGWIVVADGWFQLHSSGGMGSAVLSATLRYFALIGITAIFVGMQEEHV